MRARSVVGKRIVRVEQERCTDRQGKRFGHVKAIVLEDGSRITFSVVELEGDYAIDGDVWKQGVRS